MPKFNDDPDANCAKTLLSGNELRETSPFRVSQYGFFIL